MASPGQSRGGGAEGGGDAVGDSELDGDSRDELVTGPELAVGAMDRLVSVSDSVDPVMTLSRGSLPPAHAERATIAAATTTTRTVTSL